jgi:hypothetical protein
MTFISVSLFSNFTASPSTLITDYDFRDQLFVFNSASEQRVLCHYRQQREGGGSSTGLLQCNVSVETISRERGRDRAKRESHDTVLFQMEIPCTAGILSEFTR